MSIDDAIYGILAWRDHDITAASNRIATEESARFVVEHMPTAEVFDTREALLHWALEQEVPDGVAVEFGVAGGDSLAIIAAHREAYGFDSFDGLPTDWRTGFPKGTFACEPPDIENSTLIIGQFSDTVPTFDEPIAFCHIDCDLYTSTLTALTGIDLRPGVIIVFDEFFNYPGWQRGEYRALTESGLQFDYLAYNRFGEQVAIQLQ
jgi:hypothetical protein